MSFEALSRAAESGDSSAQLQLGIAWMTGQGVPAPDVVQGREWLARSADSGNTQAQRFLGIIYLRGMDVVPDFQRALDYLDRAANNGDAEAGWTLASYLGGGRDEAVEPERALDHLRSAAAAGHPRALAHMAYCQFNGIDMDRNVRGALRDWSQAAAAGDAGAILALAECCEWGVGVHADPARAYWLARKAAAKGWPVAEEYAESLAAHASAGPPEPLWPTGAGDSPADELPPPRLEVLAWQPRVILVHRLLSTFECAEIAAAAIEHLMPSFIVDGDGQLGKHQIRTSHEVRLRPGIRNIVIRAVESRMADWSHFPVDNGEYPLVLRYENQQSFEQHYDYFIPEKFVMGEGPLEFGGQRIATQLVYLNEAFEGGETRFDRAGLEVRPQRGMCMLFHNVGPDHNVDPLTRHTGVAVRSGVKWLLSRWIREIAADTPAKGMPRDRYRSP